MDGMGGSTLSETVAYDMGLALPAPQKCAPMGTIIADHPPFSRDGRSEARMHDAQERNVPHRSRRKYRVKNSALYPLP
jgi:hypothetical protein